MPEPDPVRRAADPGRLLVGLVACILSSFLTIGCGALSSPTRVLSWCPRDSCPGVPSVVLREGVLGGDSRCLWLDLDGTRGEVRWPPGFTGVGDPLAIHDPGGIEVARPGDSLSGVILGPREAAPSEHCGLDVWFDVYMSDSAMGPSSALEDGSFTPF